MRHWHGKDFVFFDSCKNKVYKNIQAENPEI